CPTIRVRGRADSARIRPAGCRGTPPGRYRRSRRRARGPALRRARAGGAYAPRSGIRPDGRRRARADRCSSPAPRVALFPAVGPQIEMCLLLWEFGGCVGIELDAETRPVVTLEVSVDDPGRAGHHLPDLRIREIV